MDLILSMLFSLYLMLFLNIIGEIIIIINLSNKYIINNINWIYYRYINYFLINHTIISN